MKILVLGGSYFYGRVFVMQVAKKHDITVVNRGTFSMDAFNVTQIKGNRKNISLWKNCIYDYDVIVDFCGYDKDDIKIVLDNISGKIKQYIFISTVDVYERGNKLYKCEETSYEKKHIQGEYGQYIAGKIALEKELIFECQKRNIYYTILRPAILYGPFNYAPRESVYIQMLVQNHILPQIINTTGKFQFVYIKDAAEAIIKCLLNPNSFGKSYNICNKALIDYDIFYNELRKAADIPFDTISMTASQALAQNIPLPFPLTEDETELYTNRKSITELGLDYIEFSEGIAKTYNAFKSVFIK